MARYIDADKLWNDRPQMTPEKSMNYKAGFSECLWAFSKLIRKQIDNPAADVVEVVRCKDCKWWYEGKIDPITNYHYGCCERPLGEYYECDSNFNTTSNDFCSCGERKE